MTNEERKLNTSCHRVLISGAYGADNIGDEAMLHAIIAQLRDIEPDIGICVITRAPEQARRLYGVDAVFTFDLFAVWREMKKADLFISGGGNLIQNVTSRRSLWYYLNTLSAAKKRGCRVLMYGCGIGPLNGEGDRRRAADILNGCVDCITLREAESAQLLEELGVKKPEMLITADLVLSLEPAPAQEVDDFMADCGMEPDGQYVCFGLRPWSGLDNKLDTLADAVRYTYETLKLTPVFLSMNYNFDRPTAERVAQLAGVPCILLPRIDRPDMALGILGRMKLTAAMRLHAVLMSASLGVPVVGISYDPKVSAFTSYVGCGSSLELDCLDAQELREALSAASTADRTVVPERVRALGQLNAETLARFLN